MRGFKTVNTLFQCKNKYSSASYFFFYNLLYKLEIRLHADSYHINEMKEYLKERIISQNYMKKLQPNRKHNNTELVRIHIHVSYYFNFCPKHIKAVHKKNTISISIDLHFLSNHCCATAQKDEKIIQS